MVCRYWVLHICDESRWLFGDNMNMAGNSERIVGPQFKAAPDGNNHEVVVISFDCDIPLRVVPPVLQEGLRNCKRKTSNTGVVIHFETVLRCIEHNHVDPLYELALIITMTLSSADSLPKVSADRHGLHI